MARWFTGLRERPCLRPRPALRLLTSAAAVGRSRGHSAAQPQARTGHSTGCRVQVAGCRLDSPSDRRPATFNLQPVTSRMLAGRRDSDGGASPGCRWLVGARPERGSPDPQRQRHGPKPRKDQRLSGIQERCGSGEPRPDNLGMHYSDGPQRKRGCSPRGQTARIGPHTLGVAQSADYDGNRKRPCGLRPGPADH